MVLSSQLMETGAFTRAQADEICEDFEDLVDTELIIKDGEGAKTYLVDHVVPVPFPALDKEMYMSIYNETLDPFAALTAYSGNEFDVFIICQYAEDSTDVVMMDIHTYVSKYGVGYHFPS